MYGIIEGFYGTPWTWEQRRDLATWCAARGMTHYVHAPKDDPRHRARWAEPWDATEVRAFADLVAHDALEVGIGLSPGLSIDVHDAEDRTRLAAKVDQVLDVGARLIVLALDDIPVRPGLGPEHAELTRWLADHVAGRGGRVVLVPTEYTGTDQTPYLDALADGVPREVPIAWTGRTVVCDEITVAEARARAAAVGDRAPLLWDNYPVNDTLMADRLFLGPLRGRPAELPAALDGYLANPMVQPVANRLPLASTAAWLRGEDADAAWEAEAEALGWRTFAEGCDGARPRELVDATVAGSAGALDALEDWLRAAATCTAPGLEEEGAPWLEQLHTEAEVGRTAIRAVRLARSGSVGDELVGQAMALSMLWPAARRATVSVLGPRCSFRPVISQWPDGAWRFHADAAQVDLSALDDLVRWALVEISDPRAAAPP